MALEEKRAWIVLVLVAAGYGVYVVLVLGSAGPVAEAPYVAPLLWTVGATVVATIALSLLAAVGMPADARTRDERDRDIERFGEATGQSFTAIGGIAALVMAMAEVGHFWIANALYLMFALSAATGAAARIAAYRQGLRW